MADASSKTPILVALIAAAGAIIAALFSTSGSGSGSVTPALDRGPVVVDSKPVTTSVPGTTSQFDPIGDWNWEYFHAGTSTKAFTRVYPDGKIGFQMTGMFALFERYGRWSRYRDQIIFEFRTPLRSDRGLQASEDITLMRDVSCTVAPVTGGSTLAGSCVDGLGGPLSVRLNR
jgi:hypothetical protein